MGNLETARSQIAHHFQPLLLKMLSLLRLLAVKIIPSSSTSTASCMLVAQTIAGSLASMAYPLLPSLRPSQLQLCAANWSMISRQSAFHAA